MSSIVVTIKDGKGGIRDLELPKNIPISTLGIAMAKAVHHPDLPRDETPVKAILKFEGEQEVIPQDKTLKAAGVAHGDILLLMVKPIPLELSKEQSNLIFSGPGFMHPGGKTYPFREKDILIGRTDRASGIVPKVLGVDLTDLEDLEDPSVSRRHAQVLYREGKYLLQDLRSTNGTTINGQVLPPETRFALHHGDRVKIGDIMLFFIWDGQEEDFETSREHSIETEGKE